ncbi:MAG: ATP-binding cassette domain-containing protein [Pseudomonadota bacterium]|nr:ATP-binding cassette domain-containing protein [Pseudomonadota bacterium]
MPCSIPTLSCSFTAAVSGPGVSFQLNVDFSVCAQRAAFFGPSGSGKSLTLMALAGLLTPRQGKIEVRGKTFFNSESRINIPARKRKTGFLFQDYALFPHLNVRDNVAFGLRPIFGPLSAHSKKRVDELLELCGLTPLAGLRPHQISGGQRQRTALARALAPGPELLLLDEPFTALDQPLRQRMRQEVSRILERFDIPTVLVSHDLEDIDHFAQSLIAFGGGRVLHVVDYAAQRAGKPAQDILNPLFQAAQQDI